MVIELVFFPQEIQAVIHPDFIKNGLIAKIGRSGYIGVEEVNLPDQRFQHFADAMPVYCRNKRSCICLYYFVRHCSAIPPLVIIVWMT